GKFFRNHINFHHTYYSKDHLVSRTYLGDEGNNTPFFFIPVFMVGACTYFVLPLDLFVVQVIACAVSFYAHVFLDKEYHAEGSRLQRFAWFRRKQELHFIHHRHANSNFAVIDLRSNFPSISRSISVFLSCRVPLGYGSCKSWIYRLLS